MSWLRGRPREYLTRCWEWREWLLAVALGLWLAGYWVAQDGWYHRRALVWLVPFLLLGADRMIRAGAIRWLWAVALLLGWQVLSRSWAEPPLVEAGGAGDAVVVLLLGAALAAVGRRKPFGVWIIGGLAILGAGVVAYSLGAFYGEEGRSLAADRFRNVFVYSEGLNPVLTGMLCASGAVAAAWFTLRNSGWRARIPWSLALAVLVFGMMASQSRGPALGFGSGLGILLFFERRACLSAGITIVATVGGYFLAILWSGVVVDAIARGTTGRVPIYQWFLERLSGMELLVGWGFGTVSEIPAEELGWFVHHPHSSYLTQLVLGGVLGLGLLLVVLGWSLREAWREA
ncbi:MAG: hypothetical protein QGG01_03675, partial [Roseibacillus sp.]|nr:hypothetical protein [Roseibacillus sp.]